MILIFKEKSYKGYSLILKQLNYKWKNYCAAEKKRNEQPDDSESEISELDDSHSDSSQDQNDDELRSNSDENDNENSDPDTENSDDEERSNATNQSHLEGSGIFIYNIL